MHIWNVLSNKQTILPNFTFLQSLLTYRLHNILPFFFFFLLWKPTKPSKTVKTCRESRVEQSDALTVDHPSPLYFILSSVSWPDDLFVSGVAAKWKPNMSSQNPSEMHIYPPLASVFCLYCDLLKECLFPLWICRGVCFFFPVSVVLQPDLFPSVKMKCWCGYETDRQVGRNIERGRDEVQSCSDLQAAEAWRPYPVSNVKAWNDNLLCSLPLLI